MTFEELQEKANRRFGRRLSDREIAEIAVEQLNETGNDYDALEEHYAECEKALSALRVELSEYGSLSELAKKIAVRIDEILSIPAAEHEIGINIEKGTIDFVINGHPIDDDSCDC